MGETHSKRLGRKSERVQLSLWGKDRFLHIAPNGKRAPAAYHLNDRKGNFRTCEQLSARHPKAVLRPFFDRRWAPLMQGLIVENERTHLGQLS